jgi:predicted amidohydrolase YtcJ
LEHRTSPLVALKAHTLWSAYQHFEEKSKGSLEVGKLADFAVLDGNPITVDPMKIADIKVIETIKEGKTEERSVTCRPETRHPPATPHPG